MAVPESWEINEKVYQVLKSRNIITAWIGVHRDDSEKLITVSGVSVSHTNWYTQIDSIEDCIELMNIIYWKDYYVSAAGRWNDAPCT